jgi:hypothetical protein
MRFDLKKPCLNCPFADTPDRIVFACRERAAEIESTAYRQGFVCHLHADNLEEDEYNDGGFVERLDGSSQHCFGAIAMYIKDGGSSVPWETATDADPDLEERWWSRACKKALATIFDGEDAFLDANTEARR